jgi:hypothetical protein
MRSLIPTLLAAAPLLAAVPATAATLITGKVTPASGGHFDTRTGATPFAVRQLAQKITSIHEVIPEMWCITPDVTSVYNVPITFTKVSLISHVASGAISESVGKLIAGYVRAGTTGHLSNAHASGLIYDLMGGSINFGHAPTSGFFAAAASAGGTIPAHFFDMKNVWLLISEVNAQGEQKTQDFAYSPGGAIPEPASWAMMIVGFGLVGVFARRRDSYRSVSA